MQRRTLLTASAGLLATPGVWAQQDFMAAGSNLRSGPMLGFAEMTEVALWLQTRQPARTQIRYWPQDKPQAAQLSPVIVTTAERDHLAHFFLKALAFGTRYSYEVYLDGQRVVFPYVLAFQTQPMWSFRTDPPNFRVALGSCAYINDPAYDRPGQPYGAHMEIFTAISRAQPDLMLWLGDNVYYREADWLTEAAMRYRYRQNRELKELQPLMASVHHYAIWDDHDYGPNDSDRSFRGREETLRVFKDYWLNPSYGTNQLPGVFGRFVWGDVEFFMLDDRYHRTPQMADPQTREMLGAGQLQWLMEALTSSKATFKIIANGNQILNPIVNFEGWGKFPAEQQRFFVWLKTSGPPGVLFLSGDRHHTELICRKDLAPYPLYEFTSSPLTSGGSRLEKEAVNPARIEGTWVTGGIRNFGLLEFSGPLKDRTLTLITQDNTGKERWRYTIKAQDLK